MTVYSGVPVFCLFQLQQWMKEKEKMATDESYRDLANLQEKLKKHQAFEAELKANNDALNKLNEVSAWLTAICYILTSWLHR